VGYHSRVRIPPKIVSLPERSVARLPHPRLLEHSERERLSAVVVRAADTRIYDRR